jgi:DMSO/TMAO reductase YedYZ molybdopterin-dependent catalytic subunit
MDRRNFSRLLASVAGCVATNQAFGGVYSPTSFIPATWASQAAAMPTMARYPQKTDLILLTDRPPQLETPLRYFETDLTPNDAFFVRWHLPGIPTAVDTRTYRLEVSGSLSKPQSLSLRDLQTKFPPVSYVALCQCAGNSRSFFEPRVPGGQWGFGAMSNARWKGARLKDVLAVAGVGQGSIQVAFRGLDTAPLPQTPRYEKSLPIDRAMDGEVILAYEMNGAPLPMLNGFPLRVIVPGWYATYWVKSVSAITVLDKPLKTFWMDTAYRIPDNPRAEETPQSLAPKTVPMSTMSVHSIFVRPTATEQLRAGQAYILRGVATDGGSGIARVEVSTDQGKSWSEASLGSDLGNYSWRLWRMEWTPPSAGNYQLQVRAVSKDGQQQVTSQWNRSGYQRDVVEHVDVRVI